MLIAREEQLQRNGFTIYVVRLYLNASFNCIIPRQASSSNSGQS